jgi:hypothetical protein
MKRDPFTSTAAAAGALGSAASSAATFKVAAHAQVRTQRTGGPDVFDAGALRRLADFGVELRALAADLAHVAQHQPARAGQGGQHLNRGEHGIGVGVVAVVDQRQRLAARCS